MPKNEIQHQNHEAVQQLLQDYGKEELQDALNTMFVAALYSEQCDQDGVRSIVVSFWVSMCSFIQLSKQE